MSPASTYNKNSFTTKEKIQYALLGFIVVGGSFFLGRSLIRRAVATNEAKKSFEEGSPATYAQQIKLAFENNGWWGTDTKALRQVLQAVPSIAEFKNVVASYQKLYNQSLMLDMKSELKTTEYNEILAIIAAKPKTGTKQVAISLTTEQYQSWAQRLKAAFDITYGPIPGTDEPSIKAVFLEIPTQSAFAQLCLVYKRMYGNELMTDLKSELEFWEYPSYIKIITDKS